MKYGKLSLTKLVHLALMPLSFPVLGECLAGGRLDSGPNGHAFATPEEFYRQIFTALIDTALGGIESRFSSDTWTFLAEVESALVSQPVTTAVISDFYGSDLNGDRLDLHVRLNVS